jgi:CRP/FNR family transcriptional regulator, cyclic AMP receptor protein
MNVARLLAGCELFGAMSSAELDVVITRAVTVHYDRNERIFDEGERAEDLYVVDTGRVAITSRSPEGRESVIALMERGDLFGDMGLFDGDGRSAEARALEPSDLLRVPYDPIRGLLHANPHLLWDIVALLSRRLRTTDSALADAMFLDVPGRTAKRLLELAGDHDEFVLPVTQEELASMVGASRERVNKALSTFVRLGWITQADRHYRITSRPELERRSH